MRQQVRAVRQWPVARWTRQLFSKLTGNRRRLKARLRVAARRHRLAWSARSRIMHSRWMIANYLVAISFATMAWLYFLTWITLQIL